MLQKLLTLMIFVSCWEGVAGQSTLPRDFIFERKSLVLVGETLSLSDCRKIANLKTLEHLTIGRRIEGTFLPPEGLGLILENQKVKSLELFLVNLPGTNLPKLKEQKALKELVLGGGPFLYGERLAKRRNVREYHRVLTPPALETVSKLDGLDFLTLDAPRETLSFDLLAEKFEESKLKELTIYCEKLEGDALKLIQEVKIDRIVIDTPRRTITFEVPFIREPE